MTVTAAQSRRQRRVSEALRAELSSLLRKELSDPALAFVHITDVQLSPDLKHARVFFSTLEAADATRASRSLTRAAGRLQRDIAQRLNLRFTPVLRFVHDTTLEKANQLEALLAETRNASLSQAQALSPEEQLGQAVASASRILLATHRGPDADAAGSLLGLYKMLRLMGKKPACHLPDGLPDAFAPHYDAEEISSTWTADAVWDMTIVLDTGGLTQFPDALPDEAHRGLFVVIDHHAVHDDFGDLQIRQQISSTGELLYRLARRLAWPVDTDVAQCLYMAMVGDTGSFRYENTTSQTHEVAAELLELGASPWDTAAALFESISLSRQRLLGLVALTIELSLGGQFCQLFCTAEMRHQAGALLEDADGLSQFGRSIAGVIVSVAYIEDGDVVHLSLRSGDDVDVAHIAAQFGGGGHKRAAGATVKGRTVADIRNEMLELVAATLRPGIPS
ncbi:MAG: 30S ribosome-binding factor RbfA [Proteobacteria bacterium]|nr:30S ribosome-binding factor RbfA [Pseudomonadota bacterium]